MNYGRRRSLLPVPAIFDVHLKDRSNWMIMERLPRRQQLEAWPTMTPDSQSRTIQDLEAYLEELHNIRPTTPGWIGFRYRAPAYGHRIDNMATCGPFSSITEFHDFLIAPVRRCPRPEGECKCRLPLPDIHGVVSAHADIPGKNVLVDAESGKVAGILDWDTAEFWPGWREYRKALYGGRSCDPWL